MVGNAPIGAVEITVQGCLEENQPQVAGVETHPQAALSRGIGRESAVGSAGGGRDLDPGVVQGAPETGESEKIQGAEGGKFILDFSQARDGVKAGQGNVRIAWVVVLEVMEARFQGQGDVVAEMVPNGTVQGDIVAVQGPVGAVQVKVFPARKLNHGTRILIGPKWALEQGQEDQP